MTRSALRDRASILASAFHRRRLVVVDACRPARCGPPTENCDGHLAGEVQAFEANIRVPGEIGEGDAETSLLVPGPGTRRSRQVRQGSNKKPTPHDGAPACDVSNSGRGALLDPFDIDEGAGGANGLRHGHRQEERAALRLAAASAAIRSVRDILDDVDAIVREQV